MTLDSPTLQDAEEEPGRRLIYAVGRFDTVLRSELKHQLRALGLTISEFTTLSVLRSRNGLSNAQLARRAMVTPQAMNQVLSSLERKRLVHRPEVAGTDARGHHRARGVRLTDAGRDHAERCDELVAAVEEAAFSRLSVKERATLAGILRAATEDLRGARADAPA